MSEFEKYLTGDNDTEQKNINDGAAILTATFTGDDNDGIAVQKSPVKDDISNVAGRNSGDEERLENSYSVQESGVKDHIPNAQHDIENATGRISGDEESALKTVIQFKRVESKITFPMPNMTLRMPQVEFQETERIENSNSVQDSGVKDDIVNAEDDIANATGRNSRDAECVENSNSVQDSGVKDDIVNAKDDIANAASRNSRDAERALKAVIQFKRVELKMKLPTPKFTLGIP